MQKELDNPEHARIRMDQLLLPGQTARQVSRSIGLPWTKVRRLHEKGFLSFDPNRSTTLTELEETELTFLGTFLAHGCSYHTMRTILRGLRKPYAYDHSLILYDWAAKTWRSRQEHDDSEEAFHNLVNRFSRTGDSQSLLTLRGWTEEALDMASDRLNFLSHPWEVRN